MRVDTAAERQRSEQGLLRARRLVEREQLELGQAQPGSGVGAMLADGSEYRGRYGLGVAELERFHRPRMEILAGAAPDVLALETVPDTDEAQALLRTLRNRFGAADTETTIVLRSGPP